MITKLVKIINKPQKPVVLEFSSTQSVITNYKFVQWIEDKNDYHSTNQTFPKQSSISHKDEVDRSRHKKRECFQSSGLFKSKNIFSIEWYVLAIGILFCLYRMGSFFKFSRS